MVDVRKYKRPSQCGFTLVEVLVAILLLGIIGTAVTSAIIQSRLIYDRDSGRIQLSQQLSMVTRYLQNDILMCQSAYAAIAGQTPEYSTPVSNSSSNSFPVELERVDWENGIDRYRYDIDPATKSITRSIYHYNTGTWQLVQTIQIGSDIDADNSTWGVMGTMFTAQLAGSTISTKPQTATAEISVLFMSAR